MTPILRASFCGEAAVDQQSVSQSAHSLSKKRAVNSNREPERVSGRLRVPARKGPTDLLSPRMKSSQFLGKIPSKHGRPLLTEIGPSLRQKISSPVGTRTSNKAVNR